MSYRFKATMSFCVLAVSLSACDSRLPAIEASESASSVQADASLEPKTMNSPPSEQEIRNAVRTKNCELVTIKSVKWPDDSYRIPADYSDAEVIYEADCKDYSESQVQRITFEAQFAGVSSGTYAAVSNNMQGVSRRVWKLTLNQPTKQTAIASHTAALEHATFVNGPACNALMEKVQRNVIPCIEKIDPLAARRVQSWLHIMREQAQQRGENGFKGFEEKQIDENCLQDWHTHMDPDFGGSSPFKTCAPE